MSTKQERLQEVYESLRKNHGIHTQGDMASALHITRPAMSAAMNGNEAYLTKNLFTKICASFPGIFNLDYLLTGRGALLADQPSPSEPFTDNDLLASKNETIEAMRRELQAKEDLIAILREQIDAYKSRLKEYARTYMEESRLASDALFREVK